MIHRLRRGSISFYEGDLLSFPYNLKDEKGLLFFSELEKRFMILLTNDYIVPVEEIGIKNLKLAKYESTESI